MIKNRNPKQNVRCWCILQIYWIKKVCWKVKRKESIHSVYQTLLKIPTLFWMCRWYIEECFCSFYSLAGTLSGDSFFTLPGPVQHPIADCCYPGFSASSFPPLSQRITWISLPHDDLCGFPFFCSISVPACHHGNNTELADSKFLETVHEI